MIMAIMRSKIQTVWANRKGPFLFECTWDGRRFEMCAQDHCCQMLAPIGVDGDPTMDGYHELLDVVTNQSTIFYVSDRGVPLTFRGKAELAFYCKNNPFPVVSP